MTTPEEIKQKAIRQYLQHLARVAKREDFVPMKIKCDKKPNPDFKKFLDEIGKLRKYSKQERGYGYTIESEEVKTKNHGSQNMPKEILFETEQDYLKFIGKEKECANFKADISALQKFSQLTEWIIAHPKKIVDNHGKWNDLIKVCDYFAANPYPHLYIRELPIKVHTKFIENNKGIIKELLNLIITDYITESSMFEQRFNLKYDEPLVRFRFLDDAINIFPFNDLSLPISQFASLEITAQKVFIVENKMNMLTFPKIANSIVIFGGGFEVNILQKAQWLANKQLYYWGDLDTHGFQILSEIRHHFPSLKSFLMDRHTFDKYFEDNDGEPTNVTKLQNLTSEEIEMFNYLKINNFRLEQEKIPQDYVLDVVKKLE